MRVTVVNHSQHLSRPAVTRALRAVNRQLREHVDPFWHFGARLELAGPAGPRTLRPAGASRDGVLYLLDKATVKAAEGIHARHKDGVPYGLVFLDVCAACGDDWTVALSHEAIELLGDPMNNLLAQGPHPRDGARRVFHMFELCDAVQAQSYEVDGVQVSNFLLPGYFCLGGRRGVHHDYLGRVRRRRGPALAPFGLAPGGYICYWDPRASGDKWVAYMPGDDELAQRRYAARRASGHARFARRRAGAGVSA